MNKSLFLIQAVRGGFLSLGIEKSGVIQNPVLQREDPKLKKATPRKMVIGKIVDFKLQLGNEAKAEGKDASIAPSTSLQAPGIAS